ncbi:MAG: SH3 domain-containing protein [Bacteroidota bacterium]
MKPQLFYILIFSVLFSCSNSDIEQEKLKLEQEKLKLEREKLEQEKDGAKTDSNGKSAPEETKTQVNQSSRKAKISGTNVNMRSNHSTTSALVTQLNYGDVVSILDQYRPEGNNDEALLKSETNFYDEYSGDYVFSLVKGKAVKVISYDDEKCRISFINDKGKRGYASLSSSQLEFISGNVWYNISTSSGKKGWVLEKYIQE